jgi:hypothetical protein
MLSLLANVAVYQKTPLAARECQASRLVAGEGAYTKFQLDACCPALRACSSCLGACLHHACNLHLLQCVLLSFASLRRTGKSQMQQEIRERGLANIHRAQTLLAYTSACLQSFLFCCIILLCSCSLTLLWLPLIAPFWKKQFTTETLITVAPPSPCGASGASPCTAKPSCSYLQQQQQTNLRHSCSKASICSIASTATSSIVCDDDDGNLSDSASTDWGGSQCVTPTYYDSDSERGLVYFDAGTRGR